MNDTSYESVKRVYKESDINCYHETRGRMQDKKTYGDSIVDDVMLCINTCVTLGTDDKSYAIY